jgi:crotonobetainyl-CoA:carnitine CoA-transferase CaiB-like acyl-CoA transferase
VLTLTCLQAGKYWPELCDIIGRPELASDPRFSTHQALTANSVAAVELLHEVFLSATVDEWRARLASFTGQWTVVQDSMEAAADPQTVANGYVQECRTASGTAFRLVSAPVQFDEEPAAPNRAPEFNEHGDSILNSLGFDQDAILDLKVRGVVA